MRLLLLAAVLAAPAAHAGDVPVIAFPVYADGGGIATTPIPRGTTWFHRTETLGVGTTSVRGDNVVDGAAAPGTPGAVIAPGLSPSERMALAAQIEAELARRTR